LHVDDEGITWRTSTYTDSGSCVEVAAPVVAQTATTGSVLVRDSKRRSGPRVAFEPAAWMTLVGWMKASREA
jgi:hypothetical protein